MINIACLTKGNLCVVSVNDEGPGINPADLSHLLERYYRVEYNSKISCFRIGPYLSAEIVERHNGKIWAESEKSEFQIPFHTTNRKGLTKKRRPNLNPKVMCDYFPILKSKAVIRPKTPGQLFPLLTTHRQPCRGQYYFVSSSHADR